MLQVGFESKLCQEKKEIKGFSQAQTGDASDFTALFTNNKTIRINAWSRMLFFEEPQLLHR